MAAGTFDLVDFLSKAGVGLITGVGQQLSQLKLLLIASTMRNGGRKNIPHTQN